MSLSDWIENLLSNEPDSPEVGFYTYPRFSAVRGVATILLGGTLPYVALVRQQEDLFGRVLGWLVIPLTCVLSVFLVLRRMANPARFRVEGDRLRTDYWGGRVHYWKLAELYREPPSWKGQWDRSIAITDRLSGRTAFRVFRDLLGYSKLCEELPENTEPVA